MRVHVELARMPSVARSSNPVHGLAQQSVRVAGAGDPANFATSYLGNHRYLKQSTHISGIT